MFVLAVHTYWMCKCVHACVCMLVCMSLCVCARAFLHRCMHKVSVCVCAHTFMCMHKVCVCECVCTCTCLCVCACTKCVCVCVCVCACVRACVHACVCVCVYKIKVGSERFWSVSGLSVPPTVLPPPSVIYYECHAWICCWINISLYSEFLCNK